MGMGDNYGALRGLRVMLDEEGAPQGGAFEPIEMAQASEPRFSPGTALRQRQEVMDSSMQELQRQNQGRSPAPAQPMPAAPLGAQPVQVPQQQQGVRGFVNTQPVIQEDEEVRRNAVRRLYPGLAGGVRG